MLALLLALFLLLFPHPARAAADDWYDDGAVLQSEPITLTSPGHVTIRLFAPPGAYYVQTPELKNCNRWGKLTGVPKSDWAEAPELDEHITLFALKANRITGEYSYRLGDSSPSGRTQTYCLGVPYLWGAP